MAEYTLDLSDVKSYVATKKTTEHVGFSKRVHGCLVAEALRWKYPHLINVEVGYSNTHATVETRIGITSLVYLPPDLEEVANRFDKLGGPFRSITRQDLEDLMPDAFEQ